MRRIVLALLLLCAFAASSFANQRVQGWTESGGVSIIIPGTQGSGTQRFQQSFRGATITVYAAGTTTISTIYSDNLATPTAQANPFTANATTGAWFFYANNGRYDIRFSNGGIASPFTLGDFLLFDYSPIVDTGTGQGATTMVLNDNAAVGDTLIINASGSGGYPGGQYRTYHTNAANRNFVWVGNAATFGDFTLRGSQARLGDPMGTFVNLASFRVPAASPFTGAGVGAQFILQDGTSNLPAYTFYNATTIGLTYNEGGLHFNSDGATNEKYPTASYLPTFATGAQDNTTNLAADCVNASRVASACVNPGTIYNRGGFIVHRYSYFGWGFTGTGIDCPDTTLFRGDGTRAQTFDFRTSSPMAWAGSSCGGAPADGSSIVRIAGRYDSSTARDFLILTHTLDGPAQIYTSRSGLTNNRELRLGVQDTMYWQIASVAAQLGNWQAVTDNTNDIGALGANRPRSTYVATSMSVGTNPALAGAVRLANNSSVTARNAANSGNITVAGTNASDNVILGESGFFTMVRTSLVTNPGVTNGDWWVQCTGVTPNTQCSIQVRDQGATYTQNIGALH